MVICNELVDLIMDRVNVEYSGCHAPHNQTPLYGRRAYWRLYTKDGNYITKITAPVKSMYPNKKTLHRLLKAEVKKRIEAIGPVCQTDHYGKVCIYETDPYLIKSILDLIDGKYVALMKAGKQ